MSIIGAEDEDFENDLNDVADDQCTHFNKIETLLDRPTHLLVFLQHVFLQFEPAPMLCYLHAEHLKNLNAKETKKQFVEFYNTFLEKGANLRVAHQIPGLDRTRLDCVPEEHIKQYAKEIQNGLAAEVAKQLEDFRQKRMMGMTPNESELMDVDNHYPTDRVPTEMKEKSVAENLLDKMCESQPTIVPDEEKWQSTFSAVVFYMKHLGVKTRAADSKKSKGGFFKRQLGKTRKEESTKPKPRGFPGIPSWIGGNSTEGKPKLETEAEKEKVNQERKGLAPGRGSLSEPTAPSLTSKKYGSIIGPPVPPGVEITDGSGNNISTTNSTDPVHSEGVLKNRLDTPPQTDGGDVSPVGLGGGLTVMDPILITDPPVEETVEKESRKVARSESARVDRHSSRRRGSSRAKQSRSRSDVDLQPPSTVTSPAPLSPQHLHPVEGPIVPPEGPSLSPPSPSPQAEEMDPRFQELEQDPANWRELANPDALSNLKKKEIKRQEVINELFATEHAHVRMLSVLQAVFSKPMEREALLTAEEIAAVFPSLDEITEMHYNFYEDLKKLRLDDNFIVKSISSTLRRRFEGTEGEWFQKLTARFCSHQSWALDQIKTKQKKDSRFNSFIQEAESKPQCRRLQLKDIIPIEMQRLTKYPLLLENIAKNTEDTTEKEGVQKSADSCRKILSHVNEQVKLMENLLTLKDYQRKLDTSGLKPSNELYTEYRSIDLTQKKMVYEGSLIWRLTNQKAIEVQCVLLADLLVLLQKQDDKLILKCQSKGNSTAQEGKQMLSPIIKLGSVFLRDVATDQKAFYVIFTWDSGAQIYELVAQSIGERKTWTDVIKKAVDDLKKSGVPTMRLPLPLPLSVGGAPFSPITPNAPLSPTENGSFKNSIDQDKESLMSDKSSNLRHMLIDFLSEKGFDLIGHSNNIQEKVATSAFSEVMSLKRMLVGSISLSEDSQPGEENGEEQPEKSSQDLDSSCQSTEENQNMDVGPEEETYNASEKEGARMKSEEERSFTAPLVLSQERLEEVSRRLASLEEKIKILQTVEEDHHRLQEALSKFSLQGDNFQ